MNGIQFQAAVKAAFQSASGLASGLVVWEDEEQPFAPEDSSLLRLSLTTMVDESRARVTESGANTTLETPYVFTISAKVENLRNDGSALSTALTTVNMFSYVPFRESWLANGIVIIDAPLRPTRLNRTVDGRQMAVQAFDTRIRAVLSDTVVGTTGTISTVSGEGTLEPGSISVPFSV